jgi:hypothetical protein
MYKFLLSLTLLLSCLCQARREISFNQLSELPTILNGQTEAQLTLTISKADIKANPDWGKKLKKSMKSVATSQIDLQLELPPCVTKINAFFLYGCTKLIHLELPESVTEIKSNFLSGCTGLTNFKLPKSVTKIDSFFLNNCTGLTSFELPESITKIGSHFLSNAGLTSFELPKSITKIGHYFLSGCTRLNSFELPKSMTEIGNGFLCGCTGLTAFKLPESVTKLGWGFLSGCTRLNSFKLPKSVIEIDYSFLYGCTGLIFIKLPSSMTAISDNFLSGLKNIEIHLILDRMDGVYFVDSNEISDMSEGEKKDLLQIKGSGRILWNGEEITPKEVYQKGHIINITVLDTCTLCLLPKKYPKKPVIAG